MAATNIPSRESLLQQLERANSWAPTIISAQGLCIAGCVAAIDWQAAVDSPLVPAIGVAIMVGSTFMGLLYMWAQNKREIGDLKESTRFGEFDKHNLRRLFSQTLGRLRLSDDQLPVYITADKSLNAGALHLGLAGFFKSLNGVYLNRQVLHKLNAAEVQDIMGHELGHYYRHYLVADRFRWVTLTLGALIGILTVQLFNFTNAFWGLFVLASVASGFSWLAALPWHRHGQAIEYLCDDVGSQVHGIVPSINGLLKIGAEAETHYAIQTEMLANPSYRKLSASEIAEAIEKTIPYGHTTRDDLHHTITRELKQKSQSGDLSITGFLKYAWLGDSEDEASEEFQTVAKVISGLPRLNWESLLSDPSRIEFSLNQIEQLVHLIEANPDKVLFRLPDAAGSVDGIHPPLRNRILFLWYHGTRAVSF